MSEIETPPSGLDATAPMDKVLGAALKNIVFTPLSFLRLEVSSRRTSKCCRAGLSGQVPESFCFSARSESVVLVSLQGVNWAYP
jgi:hypothetical protein